MLQITKERKGYGLQEREARNYGAEAPVLEHRKGILLEQPALKRMPESLLFDLKSRTKKKKKKLKSLS